MSRPSDTATRRAPPPAGAREDSALTTTWEGDLADEPLSYDELSAVFGSLKRSGDWVVSDRIRLRVRMGELKLDFRDANLPPSGVVEIHCDAVIGEIKLIVPNGAEVEMEDTHAILGEISQHEARPRVTGFLRRLVTGAHEDEEDELERRGDGLAFLISGRALLGGIKVTSG